MTTKRRKFTNKFKAMVALAAIREQKPVHERAVGRSLREYYESQHGWSRTREGQHLD